VQQMQEHEPGTAGHPVWPAPPIGEQPTGPLAGVKVLDLTAYAVGPWAACNLAQLGADVVRVDPPYGDPIRAVLPRKNGEPTTYMSCTLGKRSVVLDLKDERDHATVLRLAAAADVVLENSRAGTMDRLGLGYGSLSATNPRLVYCSSSSFGDAGPMAGMGSTDPQGQAFSGFASGNGAEGGEPEVLRYIALVDLGTSMQLLNAVLVGLVARKRSGVGQHLRTSQMEGAMGLQMTRFAEFFASGTPSGPAGSGSRTLVPSRALRCSDGVWVSLTAHTAEAWQALCATLHLTDVEWLASLTTHEARAERREDVDKLLQDALSERPSTWWTQVLPRNGVPCVRLRSLDEKPEQQEHVIRNGLVRRVAHPVRGTVAVAGPMWRFERTPARLGDPELPGAHTEEILGQIADASAAVPS
jgi:crotonobetainyl-CoA:carnitine CoA-transferase CaiB-like acyl-CoA transferase